MIEVTIPRLCPALPNTTRGAHWGATKRRRDDAWLRVHAALGRYRRPALPVHVTMVRVSNGSRLPDRDNATASMKAVQDAVARWLSVDDGDEARVTFSVERERGQPATRIRIEARPAGPG